MICGRCGDPVSVDGGGAQECELLDLDSLEAGKPGDYNRLLAHARWLRNELERYRDGNR